MKMRDFLRENRKLIDVTIKFHTPADFSINDKDREEWVRNDEGLYKLARRSHVSL